MTKEKLNQLIEYVTTERFSDEIHKAKKEYYKIAGELFEDDKTYENRMTTFLEWYLFDRLLTDKTITPLELFIEENRDKLTLEYMHAYEGFLRSIHGLFIIKKIKDDQVVVYNLFDENKYVVSEKEGSIFFHKNDIFEGRIIPFNDKYFFTGTFCYHPKDALKFIKTEAKRLLNERKHLEKSLKIMNAELKSIESKLIKVSMEADKMKIKTDKSGPIYTSELLGAKLTEIETKKNDLQEQLNARMKQMKEWEIKNIEIGYRLSREQTIQKLSYMSLKWERSRQIALGDIYRNA